MRLQNQDIWFGYIKLVELSNIELPLATSTQIAQLINLLKPIYQDIEKQKVSLLQKYGEKDWEKQHFSINPVSDKYPDFVMEFSALLFQSSDKEFEFNRIQLPRKIITKCPQCHNTMQTTFLISADIIVPLLNHFVEIVDE